METNNSQTSAEEVKSQITVEGETKQQDEKYFTQKDVDGILRKRLAEQKDKFADYDSLKSTAIKVNELEVETTRLKRYEELFNNNLTDMINGISEDKKTLIPDSLSPVEKYDYINKNKSILFQSTQGNSETAKQNPIQTLEPIQKKSSTSELVEGKYKTYFEFSEKDPRGYLAWRKQNPNQSFND